MCRNWPGSRARYDGPVGVPASVSAALGQEIAGLGESAPAGRGAQRWWETRPISSSQPPRRGWRTPRRWTGLEELAARDVLRATAVPRRWTGFATRSCAAPSTRLRARPGGWTRSAAPPTRSRSARAPSSARAHHVERSARVGDEAAAAVLEQAAEQAGARAPAVAARWLAGALRLLPDTERRLGLLVALARAQAATGRLAEALDTLLEALARIAPEQTELRVRLVAACAFCENSLGRHGAAHARLLHALAEYPGDGSAGAAALQVELSADALYHSDFGEMRRWAGKAAQTARALDDRGLLAVAEALVCFAEYNLGRRNRPRPRAYRAPPGSTGSPTSSSPPGSTCRTTSASRSTSASTTTTRHGTSGAGSRSRARPVRASSWGR